APRPWPLSENWCRDGQTGPEPTATARRVRRRRPRRGHARCRAGDGGRTRPGEGHPQVQEGARPQGTAAAARLLGRVRWRYEAGGGLPLQPAGRGRRARRPVERRQGRPVLRADRQGADGTRFRRGGRALTTREVSMQDRVTALIGMAVLAALALAGFAVYRWRQRERARRVDRWVRDYLAARYGGGAGGRAPKPSADPHKAGA